MKRIRYLTLLSVLLCSTGVWAQNTDDFDPTNPAEPGAIVAKYKLTVLTSPTDGGMATGGGRYTSSERITLRATPESGYRFVNWTTETGAVISSADVFSMTLNRTRTITANFEFEPDNPGEPSDINQNVKHWLNIDCEEGGTVSSSARYKAGTSVTVTAWPQPLYDFVGWFAADGTLLTPNTSYTLTMPAEDMNLKARFNYNPDSPNEPGQIQERHVLTLSAEEGGNVYADSYRLIEGTTTTVRAYAETGFEFAGWYNNGVFLTDSPEFLFTMGAVNSALEARFNFNPGNPTEPAKVEEKKYAFYLMNIIGKPGDVVRFPVYLTTRAEARDMTFQLSFPKTMLPNLTTYTVSENATGYTVTHADGTLTEGRSTWVFTMTAGETPLTVGNTALLTFEVKIPDDAETAKGYPITINQVSVMDTEGSTQAAGTRNGRISVYKLGDTNGDDTVNALDVLNMAKVAVNKLTEIFIQEVSDINGDSGINALDVLGVVKIAVNK